MSGGPEESVPFRIAVVAALVAAGLAVVRETAAGVPGLLVVLGALPAASVMTHVLRHRPRRLLRVVVAAVGLGSVAWWLAGFTQAAASGVGAVQVSLAELFLWLQVLHMLDQPTRRGLMLSLLSSLVLVVIAAVLSVSIDLAPLLGAWAVAAGTALVLAHRAGCAHLPRIAPSPVPPTSGPARRLLLPVGVAATVVTLAAVLFLVAPVAGTQRVLAFPAELRERRPVPVLGGLSNPAVGGGDAGFTSRPGGASARKRFGYFGFTRELDTAARGRPDDTLVMRVRARAPDFWRGQTFDAWDGRRWTITDERARPVTGGRPIVLPRPALAGLEGILVPTDDLVQTFILERPGPNIVFGAADPRDLYFPERRVFQLDDGTLRSPVELEDGAIYTVVSERRLVTAGMLRAAPADPAAVPTRIRERYAAPPVITPRVAALARRVTAGATNWYDTVRALERHLARTTRYSLRIPPLPPGRDAVDQYLFVDRRGFCEQIGTSLVVMLRSLGIPARLVVGYVPGERNPFTGLYEVRARDAHAWAEVYFPGVGWQGFDPTASVPLAGDSALRAAGAGLLAYLDARLALARWAPPVLGGLAVGLGAMLVLQVARRLRRRRAAGGPCSRPLERALARRFRARSPGETLPAYASAFGRVHPDLAGPAGLAAALCDRAVFGPHDLGPDERAALAEAIATIRTGPRVRGP